jgi:uncharacterized protein
MNLDEITSALKSPDIPPSAALMAGLAKADELAPVVYGAADKFCRGVYLLPEESELLFYGLHILAAAKHPELFDHVMAIAGQPENELQQLFPDHIPTSLKRLLLSVWNNDADGLFNLIEHGELIPDTQWALFDVLARLTFDGQIPRERTIEFLDRLERHQIFDEEDSTWWGWEEAVTKLGIKQLEPALRRVWSKEVNRYHTKQDHTESLEELSRAAANPTDPGLFDEVETRSIDDPVEAVSWVERREQMALTWRSDREDEDGFADEDDPAKSIRLTETERSWLAGFLVSSQVPITTMPFEMLDGLFTALVIGPQAVLPSQYMSEIWGTDDGNGPGWDSMEQAQYFMDLLMKHWNAIAARRNADAPHDPFILPSSDETIGYSWARGFSAGVALVETSWEPLFKDRRAAEIVMSIFALDQDDPEVSKERITPKERTEIVEQLPVILQLIAAYWRNPERQLPRLEPVRSTKVGRNEPCPCGSGKKFKKCCGSGSSPTLH